MWMLVALILAHSAGSSLNDRPQVGDHDIDITRHVNVVMNETETKANAHVSLFWADPQQLKGSTFSILHWSC